MLGRRYLENVPSIVPLLEKEYRNAAARLVATQEELNDLHPDKSVSSGSAAANSIPGTLSHSHHDTCLNVTITFSNTVCLVMPFSEARRNAKMKPDTIFKLPAHWILCKAI